MARWGALRSVALRLLAGSSVGIGLYAAATVWSRAHRMIEGEWRPAGSMSVARRGPRARLLPDARVLVVGGSAGGVTLRSAELWTPDSGAGTWRPTGVMSEGRAEHTATVLPDGRVLVTGGRTGPDVQTATRSAELWDPRSELWIRTKSLAAARAGHSAVLLADGRVLVSGGLAAGGWVSGLETWDPTTGRFSAAGVLVQPRARHLSHRLPDGRVVLLGGAVDAAPSAPARGELWDPGTLTATPTQPLPPEHYRSISALLPSGELLLVAPAPVYALDAPVRTDLWDPRTGRTRRSESLPNGRHGLLLVALPGGRVMAVGGATNVFESPTLAERLDARGPAEAPGVHLESVDVWDPSAARWYATGDLTRPRREHSATALADGRVLVAGGGDELRPLADAELWVPAP